MRLRVPDKNPDEAQGILNSLKAGGKDRKKEKWQHTYKIEVITPIFGGGVKAGVPDTQMPIRASAIRGQLRYWWRFLATNRRVDPLSGEDLFNAERDIWGGMAEEGEDFSSKVKLRVKIEKNILLRFQGQHKRQYAEDEPKYALFPAREQTGEHPQPAKYLIWPDPKAELTFELLLSAPKKYIEEVEQALRWWVTFGGIGARTRRGCGSIHCLDPELNPISVPEAEAAGCELKFQGNLKGDALFTWKKAVNCLHKFRQGENIGRKGKFGRSKWPEPDSIREIAGTHLKEYRNGRLITHEPEHKAKGTFPRAAFGLPIIFKFKNDHRGEPPQSELTPVNSERLSSPLILTPYPERQNKTVQYKPAALLMKREHLKNLSLMLGDKRIDDWWDASKATFDPIKKYGGTDALTAFMNFFARGGA